MSPIELLAKVTMPLGEPGVEFGNALPLVARGVAHAWGYACFVRLLGADGSQLVPVAVAHPDPMKERPLEQAFGAGAVAASEGHYGRALAESGPVAVEVDGDFRAAHPTQAREIARAGVARFLLAALRTPRGPLGVIGLGREAGEGPFAPLDLALLQEIANRAALSIENARLFEEERRARGRAELAAWALREKVEELAMSETRFRAAFDGTSLGMAVLSPKWEILQTNAAFRRMVGYEEEDLRGSPLLALVHAADEPAVRADAESLRQERLPVSAARRFVREGLHPFWATLSATLVADEDDEPRAILVHLEEHHEAPPAPHPPPVAGDADVAIIGGLLHNPVNLQLLRRLVERPGHPRGLAEEFGRSEGDVQRKLRALERAGLLAGAWRHRDGTTVKEYQATGRTLELSLAPGEGRAGNGPTAST